MSDAGPAADPRRSLPSVDRLLSRPEAEAAAARWGREPLTAALRAVLSDLRSESAEAAAELPDECEMLGRAVERLRAELAPGLHRVLNGTGIVLHTNLGRAPLADEAIAAMTDAAAGYTNLEYDEREGRRGDRYDHCGSLLCRVTGAESAIVVNNNAAAVVLAVNEFARGRDVLVSRGELVEIGGSFRIPEMIERAGARLVEVGATNRTRVADYRAALTPETGLLLKVHPANFRIEGFTESASLEDLGALSRETGVPLMWDLGSAAPAGVLPERLAGPAPSGSAARAADVVSWSGDKLFGGPQAGILHGRSGAIGRLRVNPLLRAFRVDKLTLAALEATLRAWLDPALAARRLPGVRRLLEPGASVRARAEALRETVPAGVRDRIEIVTLASLVGAGSAPEQEIESAGWAIDGHAAALDEACRTSSPPLVGRVEGGRFLVDFRCLEGDDATEAAGIVGVALTALPGGRSGAGNTSA